MSPGADMEDMDLPLKATVGRKIALIGIPYDEKSSFMKGAAQAPSAIRASLHCPSSDLSSESGVEFIPGKNLIDHGDILIPSSEAAFKLIEAEISVVLKRGITPLVLGGDHSITYPIMRAFSRAFDHLNLLQLDAHPDLYESYQGDRCSHACPFARIMEEGLVERLVQAGIRSMDGHQREQARRYGVEVIEMRHMRDDLGLDFNGPVYLSVDMDVLDPAFAPGISHWEPGGLSTREVISLVHALRGQVVGADIVELNPLRDPSGITAMAAAKLVKEIAAKMLSQYPP